MLRWVGARVCARVRARVGWDQAVVKGTCCVTEVSVHLRGMPTSRRNPGVPWAKCRRAAHTLVYWELSIGK